MKTSYRKLDYAYGTAMYKLRTAIGLTQAGLARLLGVSWRTVAGWEAGSSYLRTGHLKALIALAIKSQSFPEGSEASEIRALWKVAHQKIQLDEHWLSALLNQRSSQEEQAQELHIELEASEQIRGSIPPIDHPTLKVRADCGGIYDEGPPTPKIHNLPFPPNPFFTGRASELKLIAHLFEKNERIAITQPISVSGLGGIGKTQLALEYAHRCYPNVYHCVLWVSAADKASLEAGYLSLAHLLQLPEKNEREVNVMSRPQSSTQATNHSRKKAMNRTESFQ